MLFSKYRGNNSHLPTLYTILDSNVKAPCLKRDLEATITPSTLCAIIDSKINTPVVVHQ